LRLADQKLKEYFTRLQSRLDTLERYGSRNNVSKIVVALGNRRSHSLLSNEKLVQEILSFSGWLTRSATSSTSPMTGG